MFDGNAGQCCIGQDKRCEHGNHHRTGPAGCHHQYGKIQPQLNRDRGSIAGKAISVSSSVLQEQGQYPGVSIQAVMRDLAVGEEPDQREFTQHIPNHFQFF